MSKPSLLERLLIGLPVLLFVILFALAATGTVRTYRNTTGSMTPAIPMGDHRLSVGTASVARGDIIVFEHPLKPGVFFAKRLVAVGGETVEIRAKQLFVNGQAVAEPYAVHLDPTIYPAMQSLPEPYRSRDHFGPMQVPAGSYFVLGDNRDQSMDSRYFGTIPREAVRGRVVLLFSWSRGLRKI